VAGRKVRVLAVHGVGHQEKDRGWQATWSAAVRRGLERWDPSVEVAVRYLEYDAIFERHPADPLVVARGVARLLASWAKHGLLGLLPGRRGILDVPEAVRWTAGMVVQWAALPRLRRDLRAAFAREAAAFPPDLVLAHSLGSLLAYDSLARDAALARGRPLVTFGSQVGHPTVRSAFGGRIVCPAVARWFHLFNPEDAVFTDRIGLRDPRFREVTTEFDVPGPMDHDAGPYLDHRETALTVWREAAGVPSPLPRAAGAAAAPAAAPRARGRAAAPDRRALLVGINDYPDPASRLEGCVNDCFEMSAVLQETGFRPGEIRVLLDARATAKEVLDRLEWLLEDAGDGSARVFYYSGHGARIPVDGSGEGEADSLDECLVTHDFDWTPGRAVTDDRFHRLYSQLPYGAEFTAVLDCCHSGGMTREGGSRVRGLNPPDDVRHRALRWDAEREMWVPRRLALSPKGLVARGDESARWLGASGSVVRLGRAIPLWTEERAHRRAMAEYGHRGPYTPVVVSACREDQYSYEYRHGVTSYGAFTWCLTRTFRRLRRAGRPPTFRRLVESVGDTLRDLRYDQTPEVNGPRSRLDGPIRLLER
jgi:hypothetical protein